MVRLATLGAFGISLAILLTYANPPLLVLADSPIVKFVNFMVDISWIGISNSAFGRMVLDEAMRPGLCCPKLSPDCFYYRKDDPELGTWEACAWPGKTVWKQADADAAKCMIRVFEQLDNYLRQHPKSEHPTLSKTLNKKPIGRPQSPQEKPDYQKNLRWSTCISVKDTQCRKYNSSILYAADWYPDEIKVLEMLTHPAQTGPDRRKGMSEAIDRLVGTEIYWHRQDQGPGLWGFLKDMALGITNPLYREVTVISTGQIGMGYSAFLTGIDFVPKGRYMSDCDEIIWGVQGQFGRMFHGG